MLLNFSSQKTSPHLKSFCFFEEDDDDDFFSPQLDIRIHDDIFQSCLKKARNSRRDSCYTTLCMKNKITAHRLFSLPYFGTRNCFCFDFQERSFLSARHYVINTILTKMIEYLTLELKKCMLSCRPKILLWVFLKLLFNWALTLLASLGCIIRLLWVRATKVHLCLLPHNLWHYCVVNLCNRCEAFMFFCTPKV